VHHRDGDDAVEGDHRAGRDPVQQPVQPEDLPPVGALGSDRLVVQGGDRGLQLVGADRRAGQRLGDQGDLLGDGPRVPQTAILLGERHQLAAGAGPPRPARVGEQHQREEAGDLAVLGQLSVQLPGKPDRLGGELDPVQRAP
jgi:hypothetical protein